MCCMTKVRFELQLPGPAVSREGGREGFLADWHLCLCLS